MLRFLVSTIVNAVGLWVATSVVPQVQLNPYGGSGFWNVAGSFLVVGAVFGLVAGATYPLAGTGLHPARTSLCLCERDVLAQLVE